MWDRVRYTFWAPFYDSIAGAVGFERARQISIDRLRLRAGQRVLMIGAGTGLDLAHIPPDVVLTAIDVTPAMLRRLERRAAHMPRRVTTRIMDARRLDFPDEAFDAVVMHLVLAVMPEPERGLKEAARVLVPGGRVAVFDKFLADEQSVSWRRRLLNLVARPLFSDMNRRLGPILDGTGLVVEHDEPSAFRGMYRVLTLARPGRAEQTVAQIG